MKIGKWKWLASLVATACCAVCLGVGVALSVPAAESITVQAAANTYTYTKLGATGSSSTTVIYAYPTVEAKPEAEGDWDNRFSFVAGTGDGVLWNGEAYEGWEIKRPGDFYIALGKTAAVGDEFVLDGTFYNETLDTEFVFENCGFFYNGSEWIAFTAPMTVHNIGALMLHGNSNVGGASGLNNVLYLQRADGEALPVLSWNYAFTVAKGSFTVNGVSKTPGGIKSTGDGFYWEFEALNENDIITIAGTFYCASQNVKYVVDASSFQWNGSGWSALTYTTGEIGEVAIGNGSSATAVYFDRADGGAFEVTDGTWSEKLTFTAGSGVGVTLNGKQISMGDIKIPNNMFVGLGEGATAKGDVLVIGGTFYNENLRVRYVVEESKFEWNGTAWIPYVNTVYNVSAIRADSGDPTSIHIVPKDGDGNSFGAGDWNNVYTFAVGSGDGLWLNDTQLTTTDIKQPGAFFINLVETAVAGDILKIDGAYYNVTTDKKIVFDDCYLQFDGTSWKTYINYTVYNLSAIKADVDSSASAVSLTPEDGDGNSFGAGDWDNVYTFEAGSGDGLWLNNTQLSTTDIKQPGAFRIAWGTTAVAGDVLKIDGTYYNETTEKKFIFDNCQLQYNGSAWVEYVAYTEYNVDELVVHLHSTEGNVNANNTTLWLFGTGDNSGVWAYYTCISGEGIKINGEVANAKVQDFEGGIYLKDFSVETNDVLSIGGTFVCEDRKTKYIIPDSSFVWNGSGWSVYVPPVEYTSYNLGVMKVAADSKNANAKADWIQLLTSENENLPVVDGSWGTAFTFVSGGVTYEGQALTLGDVKNPGALYIALGTSIPTGGVITVAGTLRNDSLLVEFVVEESQFVWNGSAWEVYEENVQPDPDPTPDDATTYNIGALELHVNSKPHGGAGKANNQLYLQRVDGQALPFMSWDYLFTVVEGGLKVNGEEATLSEMKSTDGGLFLLFAAAEVGDIITIGGTFYCADENIVYIIEESSFQWNESWSVYVYVPPVEYEIHNLGVMVLANPSKNSEQAKNTQLYLTNGKALPYPDGKWNTIFVYESGDGLKINDKPATLGEMKSTDAGLFLGFAGVSVGDVVSISGTFVSNGTGLCESLNVKYVIEESKFVWNGSFWMPCLEGYEDEDLVPYDVVTMLDLSHNVGYSVTIDGAWDRAGATYYPSLQNTTGSVKFRFGIQGSDLDAGALDIRLRGSAWDGIQFKIAWKQIFAVYQYKEEEKNDSCMLSNNTYYVIELGAIDLKDGENIWIYAKVDDMLVLSDTKPKTTVNGETNTAFGAYTNPSVSLSATDGWASAPLTLTDPDHVIVTYETEKGSFVDYANKSGYEVIQGRSYETFIVWKDSNNTYYYAGDTYEITENITLTAVEISFLMQDGAAIRIASTADQSGIRFTTSISKADLATLESSGIIVKEYGTLILPYDYLKDKNTGKPLEPNLDNFKAGETILKIPSTYQEDDEKGECLVYRGAMKNLYTDNYVRAFAGRGYMILDVGGRELTVYTPFNKDVNVRSVRFVAQRFQEDTEAYNKVSDEAKGVVEAYAANNSIQLMDYDSYKANNKLDLIAWYYPELDPSNAYVNDTNKAIAKKMTDAGITAVYLDGEYHIDLINAENIERTRQIIEFFWTQGLQTIAFASNSSSGFNIDYRNGGYPDFSDCEGFIGFLIWDEPSADSFDELQKFAAQFNALYAGTDVPFMVNLLPSYAKIFNPTTSSWFGSSSTLDKTAYEKYLQDYCDTVLSQIDGEKWLSLDTYPVNEDYSLSDTFLYDLGMLKTYSLYAGATSHVVLQSSGWEDWEDTNDDGVPDKMVNDDKNRMPEEAELRMQAYAAMAFGIDSISWWSYADKRDDHQSNPTDNDDYYTPFKNVNTELSAISSIYSAFDWKGIIIGKGEKDGGNMFRVDNDMKACEAVMGELGAYELSVGKTKHLSSIANSNAKYNYLMGVMQDMNGNEGYVLCNYNAKRDYSKSSGTIDKSQTITLTFDSNVTEVVIYCHVERDGKRVFEKQTLPVSNKTLTVSLATGEGAIILPSAM